MLSRSLVLAVSLLGCAVALPSSPLASRVHGVSQPNAIRLKGGAPTLLSEQTLFKAASGLLALDSVSAMLAPGSYIKMYEPISKATASDEVGVFMQATTWLVMAGTIFSTGVMKKSLAKTYAICNWMFIPIVAHYMFGTNSACKVLKVDPMKMLPFLLLNAVAGALLNDEDGFGIISNENMLKFFVGFHIVQGILPLCSLDQYLSMFGGDPAATKSKLFRFSFKMTAVGQLSLATFLYMMLRGHSVTHGIMCSFGFPIIFIVYTLASGEFKQVTSNVSGGLIWIAIMGFFTYSAYALVHK